MSSNAGICVTECPHCHNPRVEVALGPAAVVIMEANRANFEALNCYHGLYDIMIFA